jgi:hypothetical protein
VDATKAKEQNNQVVINREANDAKHIKETTLRYMNQPITGEHAEDLHALVGVLTSEVRLYNDLP